MSSLGETITLQPGDERGGGCVVVRGNRSKVLMKVMKYGLISRIHPKYILKSMCSACTCACPDTALWKKVCPHVLALFLLYYTFPRPPRAYIYARCSEAAAAACRAVHTLHTCLVGAPGFYIHVLQLSRIFCQKNAKMKKKSSSCKL